ncbi:MAG: putative ferredoxin reductase [Actinomycetia bacterium]|nr:putative ferredoxin reductase [Actinomycetes bacterium]
MSQTFVIAGGGLAGAKAADTLRAEGFAGRIVLASGENEYPYERPPLSKGYLQGKDERESAQVFEPSWYAENNVELLRGTAVTGLDPAGHVAALANGQSVTYDKLLIATGAVPRPLAGTGSDLDGIHYLRNLTDSERIRDQLGEHKHLLVVGAGWIGLEVAAAARMAGAQVTVVEVAALPLERVLGRECAQIFARLHAEQGVDLRLQTGLHELIGQGRAERALLTDGSEIEIDAVVVGIGAAPADDLAKTAGLQTSNGILTDEHLRTSEPDIFAAGDVANAWHPLFGERVRTEHWANALTSGPAAARSMLGQDVTYDPVPYFFSDQYSLGMEYAGWIGPAGYDEVVFRGDVPGREFVAFWLRAGVVLAGMNVNVWDVSDDIQALVRSRAVVDRARLADHAVPITELVPR